MSKETSSYLKPARTSSVAGISAPLLKVFLHDFPNESVNAKLSASQHDGNSHPELVHPTPPAPDPSPQSSYSQDSADTISTAASDPGATPPSSSGSGSEFECYGNIDNTTTKEPSSPMTMVDAHPSTS